MNARPGPQPMPQQQYYGPERGGPPPPGHEDNLPPPPPGAGRHPGAKKPRKMQPDDLPEDGEPSGTANHAGGRWFGMPGSWK